MAQRRLLMITYHFAPSAAVAVYRMLGLVRYLPEHGWETTVVAPPGLPWEPTDPALLQKVPAATTLIQVPLRQGGMWNKVQARFMPFLRWHPDAKKACLRAIQQQRPDVVYTSSPPGCVHYLGMYLKKRLGLPWMACLRDPWITNRRVEEPVTWQRRVEAPMEARTMRQADCIVANTPLNLQGLSARYPDQAHKMVYIYNGFEADHFPRDIAPVVPKTRLTLLHAGELYSGRDPRPLLDVFRELHARSDRPQLYLNFMGRSTEGLVDLTAEIAKRNLQERVQVEGQAPYGESLQRMLQADILLLIHSPRYRVGVPAKLYEYLGARKPILALAEPESDIALVLRQSGLPYRLAPTKDPSAIRQALDELSEIVARGQWTQPTLDQLRPFTRAWMGRQFAQRLNHLVNSPT